MIHQAALGLLLHSIGGFAAASFYAPLKFIRRWPWESYYLVMGLFAWLVAPWLFGFATVPHLIEVLSAAPPSALGWTLFFGALWGIGAVTYGLTMRFLGLALGMSIVLGFSAVFGALVPPLVAGRLGEVATSAGGRWNLVGIGLCLAGIVISGGAGVRKEREIADRRLENGFSLAKGLAVAVVSGLMSACFAFGLKAGEPIAALARANGTDPLFVNNAVLCVILAGGVATNTLWCLFLNRKHQSFPSYSSQPVAGTLRILGLTAAAGLIWYLQFFFYGMGMTKMGAFEFSSWSLHMSAIIIFGNLWGIGFKEWKGTSSYTRAMAWAGILVLVLSTIAIGWGNAVASQAKNH